MILLIGSITIGLILSLLAMGILISFRVVAFEDLTVDGSLTLGGAVAATLIVNGTDPWLATGVACLAGSAAGVVTALLHTRCHVNRLLAGILVMTALYSVNLRIMGRSNIPLLAKPTLLDYAEAFSRKFADGQSALRLGRWEIPAKDLGVLIVVFVCAI